MRFHQALSILLLIAWTPDGLLAQTSVRWWPIAAIATEPLSPEFAGMGGVGVALPGNDPYAAAVNPAHVGRAALDNKVAAYMRPTETDAFFEMNRSHYAAQLGYNLRDLYRGLPLAVGLGYHRHVIERPDVPYVDDQGVRRSVDLFDRVSALSFGLGFDYYVRLAIGLSLKSLDNNFGFFLPAGGSGITSSSALDYGVLLEIPMLSILQNAAGVSLHFGDFLQPRLDLGLGYSLANIGDDLVYNDGAINEKLLRMARLGYSITAAIDGRFDTMDWRLASYTWTVDAQDNLVRFNPETRTDELENALEDVKFFRHLILGDKSFTIEQRRGWRIELAEVFAYQEGNWNYPIGNNLIITEVSHGRSWRLRGIFKLAALLTSSPALRFCARHLDLRYSKSKAGAGYQQSQEWTYESLLFTFSAFRP